ncbi:MAG TPA: multiheme c-type cytochrome [Terriglobia bacterium]|nr:multiheme c-type cytochrome [Terriglobia bacterium]
MSNACTSFEERVRLGSAWVLGALVFVSLSGVAVWLLSFSVGTQVTLLLHSLCGLAVLIPLGNWQLGHWLATRKAPRSLRKICAYTGFWMLAASCVTGLIVTLQALFALRVQSVWDRLHLWTGILALPFLVYHVYPARSSQKVPEPGLTGAPDASEARRRIWIRAAAVSLALIALAVAATLAYRGPSYDRYEPQTNYQSASAGGPFSPSFATTTTGRPVSPEIVANSASCGASGCHSVIYQEWLASAHHWSAEDQFFEAVRSATTEVQGLAATEKCAACHEPVALLAGYKNPRLGAAAPGYREGDSCVVCHAVRRVDERGIGGYEIGVPRPYLYEYSRSAYASAVAHFMIRAYPRQHDSDYDLKIVRLAESCAPCHKEWDLIDKSIGAVEVETQYDDWHRGKWNTNPDLADRLRCQQCHMYYASAVPASRADPYDLKIGLGRRYRNHSFAAGNQFMPEQLEAPDAAGQVERVNQWLQGHKDIPEISRVWPEGSILALDIQAPPVARPGVPVAVKVVLTNKKVGHGFPTGPLNIGRAWIELKVLAADGRLIFHSGDLDAQNHVETGSYILRPLAITTDGREIMMPDLWHPAGPQFRPAVLPGQSEEFDYQVEVPGNVRGPLSVAARLRYRKANQFFMDSVYPDARREAPITDISSGRLRLEINAARARTPSVPAGNHRGQQSLPQRSQPAVPSRMKPF